MVLGALANVDSQFTDCNMYLLVQVLSLHNMELANKYRLEHSFNVQRKETKPTKIKCIHFVLQIYTFCFECFFEILFEVFYNNLKKILSLQCNYTYKKGMIALSM